MTRVCCFQKKDWRKNNKNNIRNNNKKESPAFFHYIIKVIMVSIDNIYIKLCLVYWVAFCYFRLVSGTTHYCKRGLTTVISNETLGSIRTVESGKSFYGDDVECSWLIDGGFDTRIQLNVTLVDLQWAPTYTLCSGYDNLQIRDGNSSSSKSLVAICGSLNPYEVISTGRYLLLTFQSNDKNFYDEGGISLNFEIFANTACPPGWRTHGGSCYKIQQQTEIDWSSAQTFCGYSQSNLVTITSESVFNLIQEYGRSLSQQYAWIGLNDIVKEGTYRWLNNTALSLISKYDETSSSKEKDCVAYNFNRGVWMSKYCVRDTFNFICQRNKVGDTQRLKVPSPPIEETEPVTFSVVWAIVLGIVAGIIAVILGIIVYCCCCLKQRKKPHTRGATETENLSQMPFQTERTGQRHHSQRGSEPSAPTFAELQSINQNVAPPTYDEAMSHDIIK